MIEEFAKELDSNIAEVKTQEIIEENANQDFLDFEDIDEETGEILDSEIVYEEDEEIISDGQDEKIQTEAGY